MDDYSVVKVRFSKGFVFACVQVANDFEDQRTRFFNENEIRDDYMEVGVYICDKKRSLMNFKLNFLDKFCGKVEKDSFDRQKI
jgi:hypothetical protein